jgi:hypothetical protein
MNKNSFFYEFTGISVHFDLNPNFGEIVRNVNTYQINTPA